LASSEQIEKEGRSGAKLSCHRANKLRMGPKREASKHPAHCFVRRGPKEVIRCKRNKREESKGNTNILGIKLWSPKYIIEYDKRKAQEGKKQRPYKCPRYHPRKFKMIILSNKRDQKEDASVMEEENCQRKERRGGE